MNRNRLEVRTLIIEGIACDMDEVVAPLVRPFLEFHLRRFEYTLPYEAITDYFELDKIFCEPPGTLTKRFQEFILCESLKIEPLEGAFEALVKISRSKKCEVVTSRQDNLTNVTKEYFRRHSPISLPITVCNHLGSGGLSLRKPDVCLKVGASLLIDDCLEYTIECAAKGYQAFLFGDYPWNRGPIPLEYQYLITRTLDWEAVLKNLELT